MEEINHPKSNRQNQGCRDDITETNPLPSVGDVYDKVNEEYIKRMKDLEKSIEERSEQEIIVERQTKLQEYWKKVQVSEKRIINKRKMIHRIITQTKEGRIHI